jgi:hypothetical protein
MPGSSQNLLEVITRLTVRQENNVRASLGRIAIGPNTVRTKSAVGSESNGEPTSV